MIPIYVYLVYGVLYLETYDTKLIIFSTDFRPKLNAPGYVGSAVIPSFVSVFQINS